MTSRPSLLQPKQALQKGSLVSHSPRAVGPSVWLAMLDEGVCVSCVELQLKAPEPAVMGALNLAVWAHCWVWVHAGAAAGRGPRLGSVSRGLAGRAAASGSFAAVLSAPLWVRSCGFGTGTGGGVMRELQGEQRLALGGRLTLI